MSMIRWFAAVVLVAAAGFAFGEEKPKPTTDDLARQLVNTVARVQDGDVVVITGEARDAALLESLSVATAKAGGDPLVVLAPSPKTFQRLFLEVPEKYDRRTSPAALAVAQAANVVFFLESTDYGATKDVPAERLQARYAAGVAVNDKHLARNVKQVYIGNLMYPSEANASRIGLTQDELAAMFQAGLAVDYAALRKTAAAVKEKLAGK